MSNGLSQEGIRKLVQLLIDDLEFREQFLQVAKVVNELGLAEVQLSGVWTIDAPLLKLIESGEAPISEFALPSSKPE